MVYLRYSLILFLIVGIVLSSEMGSLFIHDTPQGVIQGEKAHIEVLIDDPEAVYYDMYLFFREIGEDRYQSVPMSRSGYYFQAQINTTEMTASHVEYYIAFTDGAGKGGSLPAELPELNPMIFTVAPQQQEQETNGVEIVILGPEPGEIVSYNDLVVSASIFDETGELDFSKTMLLVDGVNVTTLAQMADGILTFTPQQIRQGPHNIELNVYNAAGNIVGKKEWSFIARDTFQPSRGNYNRGSLYLENRYRDLQLGDNNRFSGDGVLFGGYNDLEYRARLLISTDESSDRQPVNRYSGRLRYRFSENDHLYLRGGDFTPYYNPLVFDGTKRLRGVQTGLAYGFFTFDYMYGQLYRAVEGKQEIYQGGVTAIGDTLSDTLNVAGTYAQNLWAVRPGFRFGDNVFWNLNLVNSKEKKNSITYGGKVNEALIVGSDISMTFDRNRINVDASYQASVKNVNAGLTPVTWDDLVRYDESLEDESAAKQAYDLLESTKFLSLTEGLVVLPSQAYNFEARLNYYKNSLQLRLYKTDREFASPGNPFLLKDISGLYIGDRIRLLTNKLILKLYLRSDTYNKSEEELAVSSSTLGTEFVYFPAPNLPSIAFGYANLNRRNDVSAADTVGNRGVFIEDNTTNKFHVTVSYNLLLGSVNNNLSLSFNGNNRDDQITDRFNSNQKYFGGGVTSRFPIPITSKITLYQYESVIGSKTQMTSTTQHIGLQLQYKLKNLMGNDELQPFVRYGLQNIEITSGYKSDRTNYAGGFLYRNPLYGIMTFEYSYYAFALPAGSSLLGDYTNTIIRATYGYNF
jgi:hypothetical protein